MQQFMKKIQTQAIMEKQPSYAFPTRILASSYFCVLIHDLHRPFVKASLVKYETLSIIRKVEKNDEKIKDPKMIIDIFAF
jgi:hypothetical protein